MLFAPHLITRNSQDNLVSLRKPQFWGQRLFIVPRAKCAFRRLALKGSPRMALKAAYLKARTSGLDQHDKFLIVPDSDNQNAGQWGFRDDADFVAGCLPESLAYPSIKEGARLIECLQGVEGQVWQAGNLIASRWWRKLPTDFQWQSFLRSIPASADYFSGTVAETRPELQKLSFRSDLPILSLDTQRLQNLLSPMKLAGLGLGVLSLVGVFFMAQYLHSTIALKAAEEEIVEISDEARTLLSLRRRALGHQAYVERYKQLGDKSMILRTIDGVAPIVGAKDFTLDSFRIRDGKIEMRAYTETEFDQASLVGELESIPTLNNVTLTVGSNGLVTIGSRLVPHTFHELPSLPITSDSSGG